MAIARSHLLVAILVGACSASARSSTGAPVAPVTSVAPVASAEHMPVTAAEHVNAEGVLYVPTVVVAAPWPPRAGQ